jgi:hypothetical protein
MEKLWVRLTASLFPPMQPMTPATLPVKMSMAMQPAAAMTPAHCCVLQPAAWSAKTMAFAISSCSLIWLVAGAAVAMEARAETMMLVKRILKDVNEVVFRLGKKCESEWMDELDC